MDKILVQEEVYICSLEIKEADYLFFHIELTVARMETLGLDSLIWSKQ